MRITRNTTAVITSIRKKRRKRQHPQHNGQQATHTGSHPPQQSHTRHKYVSLTYISTVGKICQVSSVHRKHTCSRRETQYKPKYGPSSKYSKIITVYVHVQYVLVLNVACICILTQRSAYYDFCQWQPINQQFISPLYFTTFSFTIYIDITHLTNTKYHIFIIHSNLGYRRR